jgi:hypothetical protein
MTTRARVHLRSNRNPKHIFEGDSLDLLQLIYKDKALPLAIRQDAALGAIRFERAAMSEARILLLKAEMEKQSEEERNRLALEDNRRLDDLWRNGSR